MMAIRVLLDYDVPEENIQLVSLLMAEIGVHSIAYAFPKVINQINPFWNIDFFFRWNNTKLIDIFLLILTGSNCNNGFRSRNQ